MGETHDREQAGIDQAAFQVTNGTSAGAAPVGEVVKVYQRSVTSSDESGSESHQTGIVRDTRFREHVIT